MNPSVRVAEQLYAALEADDVQAFLSLCADDVTFEYPAADLLPYGGSWPGLDGVARFMDLHDEAEEILQFDVERMVAEEDTVLVLGTFAGQAKPEGRGWSTRFVHQLTISGGKLRRWQASFDTAAAVVARSPTG